MYRRDFISLPVCRFSHDQTDRPSHPLKYIYPAPTVDSNPSELTYLMIYIYISTRRSWWEVFFGGHHRRSWIEVGFMILEKSTMSDHYGKDETNDRFCFRVFYLGR